MGVASVYLLVLLASMSAGRWQMHHTCPASLVPHPRVPTVPRVKEWTGTQRPHRASWEYQQDCISPQPRICTPAVHLLHTWHLPDTENTSQGRYEPRETGDRCTRAFQSGRVKQEKDDRCGNDLRVCKRVPCLPLHEIFSLVSVSLFFCLQRQRSCLIQGSC